MEFKRKKINNLHNIKLNINKNNRIIYSVAKKKINRANSEYLNFLNNPISNRFIYNKFLNKIKIKNLSISTIKKKNQSNSKCKINHSNDFNKFKNANTKNYSQNYANKKKITFNNRIFTRIYREENKKVNNHVSLMTVKNENKTIYKNKKDDISYKEILNLWDKLFIDITYRKIFNELLSKLEQEDKNKLILNEYNELNDLLNELHVLLYNIKLRKEIINKLQQINKDLKLIFNSERKEPNNFLVKNMSNYIEKLRKATINICFAMKKIKNKVMNGNLTEKYNIDIISQNYNFDKNYLIKMKEEMKFLREGNARFFFKISEDRSPFLIKASEEDENSKNDPFICIVPMNEVIKLKIEKCNYIIYQELIAYQNKDLNNNIYRPISPPNNHNKDLLAGSKSLIEKKNKIMINKNLFLDRNRKKIEKFIPQKELEIKFPCIKSNNNYKHSILKSNSCINFEINSKGNNKRTFFLTNLKKIDKNNIIEISNNEINNVNLSKL
jgi:hypothetical protein